MASSLPEGELRDALAANISVLEPGLTLLKKEEYIPNSLGTRGFIDLLARDPDNHFVLVELKRSDAASREAIHEILKYTEGVKRHFRARDDEIRVIIASTEWRELLVPFSRFVADSAMSVTGLRIIVDSGINSLRVESIAPLKLTTGRFLAPWHELNYYLSERNLAEGIRDYEAACTAKGIEDYVLTVLRASPGFHDAAQDEFRANLAEVLQQFGQKDEARVEEMASKLPNYQFALYFAPQTLDREFCLAVIARDPKLLEETEHTLADMEEEEGLSFLHETLYAFPPEIRRDWGEIGYPAKFQSRFRVSSWWTVTKVLRYGAFSRNTLLPDDEILEELAGSEGVTGQRFKRKIKNSNRGHIASAKAGLQSCLEFNPVWCAHTLRHLAEIERDYPEGATSINVFNPSAGLMTLYFAATSGPEYVPIYFMNVQADETVKRVYFGCLMGEGTTMGWSDLLEKYYEGKIGGLMFTLSWGGYEQRDAAILEDCGLFYRSFRVDLADTGRQFFALRDEKWREIEPFNPLDMVYQHFNTHPELVERLVEEVSSRQHGGLFEF